MISKNKLPPRASNILKESKILKDIINPELLAKKNDKPKPTLQGNNKETLESQGGTIDKSFFGQINNVPFSMNISVEAKDPESIRVLINLIKELRSSY